MKELILQTNDLTEYIEKILSCKHKHDKEVLYYRGQNNISYKLLPAVLRNKNYYLNESELFNSFLSDSPNLFKNCKNNYDRLTIMQHHQLPTRLLDVTKNPLIALFFACLDSEDNDGCVYIFSDRIDSNSLKRTLDFLRFQGVSKNLDENSSNLHKFFNKTPYSDEIELEASLIRISMSDRTNILREVSRFYDFLCGYSSWSYEYNKWIKNNKVRNSMEDTIWKEYKKLAGFGSFAVQQLFHEAKKDIQNFRVMMNPIQLILPKLVSSRLIDGRIKNQRGAFIFTPFISKSSFDDLKVKTEMLINILRLHDKQNKMIKIVIPNSKKKEILRDLSLLGIDSNFVYPDDYSIIADKIKGRYC
ncbi:FRG domain-containing protein [Limosilactobacillus urinaemulieris]|uniref:FRG domain-containing protein n=1 Tax=Limosilactobacillus urinaemulieris TaxID=2742600 RepID=UPI001F594FF3|nr:FRG domain-containing protein [Limosilactobacillus urinaemulieris]